MQLNQAIIELRPRLHDAIVECARNSSSGAEGPPLSLASYNSEIACVTALFLFFRNYLMDKFVIRGGNRLLGTIRISGAKNAALPAWRRPCSPTKRDLENIPQVRDIETERRLLAAMGAEVELGYGRAQHRTTINCR